MYHYESNSKSALYYSYKYWIPFTCMITIPTIPITIYLWLLSLLLIYLYWYWLYLFIFILTLLLKYFIIEIPLKVPSSIRVRKDSLPIKGDNLKLFIYDYYPYY